MAPNGSLHTTSKDLFDLADHVPVRNTEKVHLVKKSKMDHILATPGAKALTEHAVIDLWVAVRPQRTARAHSRSVAARSNFGGTYHVRDKA